ncbi:putative bud site selection-related protein [Kockovaella imperatae]|uniref:Putative bud site selection-related protein n=1 Tax=Kockovaella imperatae TaxID=4999 RepID=A0A1Y1UAN5_9TREE|nr:putative bud site selection-related protein [Kockovaella imperatae]ORX34135.1 putative bud site selection-related protein [Kockovaella imperatae]
MGRLRRSRTHRAQRDVHRAARTRARVKDLDQIQDDLKPQNRRKLEVQPIDETKPGLGQHYCVECAKYCETEIALKAHLKSKVHKRRLKDLKDPAYTLREAEQSAGLGVDNRQRGVEEVVKRMEGMSGVEETKSS